MTQRKYDEAEVAAIFQRAAEMPPPGARSAPSAAAGGLTLAELQAIGQDVGIPPDAITLAARTVGEAGLPPARTFLGLPLGVAYTVELERPLSEREWERVVVDLRETFDARGSLTSSGSLRQWTHGNLQALLEPTERAHRLRLRTTKGNAVGRLAGGLGMVGVSVGALITAAVQGAVGDTGMVTALGVLGLTGAAMFASSALRLPHWAHTRRRQMEALAARVVRLTGRPLSEDATRSLSAADSSSSSPR